MPAKAQAAPGYRGRLGLMALLCLGMSGMFFYDGYVSYPRQREIYNAFERVQSEGRLAEWSTIAAQRGWPDLSQGHPGKPRSDTDLLVQRGLGYAIAPIGLFFAAAWWRYRDRWIATDEQGLSTSWGVRVPYASIESLDKQRWRHKGKAVVTHRGDTGREGALVLDDWKFDRAGSAAVLADIEAHLPADRVTGNSAPPPTTDTEPAR